MNKKSKGSDYLSIKEFAKLVKMTVSTLRYYDKMDAFNPSIRGDGLKNNYRYYSPTQVMVVRMIRILTEIGVPVRTIAGLKNGRTPEKLLQVLKHYSNNVQSEIHFLQDVHSVIRTFTGLLIEGLSIEETEISVAKMSEKKLIMGELNEYKDSVGFIREFSHFCNSLHEPKLNMSYPIGGYWTDMALFLNDPSRPMRFFSIDPSGHEKKDAGLYLVGYTRGYYGQTNDLPDKMAAFAAQNELIINGPVYNIYLFNELSITDPDKYLLQVSIPVVETRSILRNQGRNRL